MKIENVDIRLSDIDHIWYNNKQYISLNRVNQMLRDKRTETHERVFIDKQVAIEMLDEQIELCNRALDSLYLSTADRLAVEQERDSLNAYREKLEYLPAADVPCEITDEQAIEHLQSTGWMQNHDREMYESGFRECLSGDGGSYDSLIPETPDKHTETHECDYEELDFVQKHERIPVTLDVQTHGDVISRADAIDAINKKSKKAWDTLAVDECMIIEQEDAVKALMKVPPAELQNREYIEQIRWERDVAISQLKELGYGLGEKIREPQKIIRCKDCKFWTHIKRTNRYWCKTDDGLYDLNPSPYDFCSRAERREG